jgi:acetolactate synthase-1/2/3 large subunit
VLQPKTIELQNVNPAQLLLRYLAMEGVTTLFGVPGGAIMQLLEELRLQADSFCYVICRQETGAAYIADGYARVSGGLGVVLVTSGPGATNALTGTMNAQNSGTSLITVSGEIKEQYFGQGYLQEGIDTDLDVDAIYRAATGDSTLLDNVANVCTLLEQALRDCRSIPGRAVHVSLPMDVAATQIPSIPVPTSPSVYRATPQGTVAVEVVAQMLDYLLAAERPLIFVGNGGRQALLGSQQAAFTALVERFAIPVMTTPEAKGVFPDSHPLSLRNYGWAGCPWTSAYMTAAAPPYDCLLVLGSSLGEISTSPTVPTQVFSSELTPAAGPFMQVDLDQSIIGRTFGVDLGVVADVGSVVAQLAVLGATRPVPSSVVGRRAFIAQLKGAPPAPPPPPPAPTGPVSPIAVMQALNTALPQGGHIFIDCGNCVGWAMSQLVVDPPTQLHAALAMGPMGFSVGAVIGAKMAAPSAACVAITGDGAFLMHGAEVSTAARYGVGAIWIVLADNDLAMVSQGMNQFFPGPNWSDYYALGAPNLAGFATALGANALEVATPGVLSTALAAAFAPTNPNQPQVVIVNVDPTEVPPYYLPKTG